MYNVSALRARWKNLDPRYKLALIFLSAAALLALATSQNREVSADFNAPVEEYLSTFIPAGQRLVPIEILNSGALDSILGRYGFVDLYLEGQKQPFARSVRIVKSIDDSGEWAALVPEELADELMAVGARFYVAIQSLKEPAPTRMRKQHRKRAVVYEGD